MTLQARLDRIKANFVKDAPLEALDIMQRAAADLQASGIMDGVTGDGQQAPDFTLDDSRGTSTSLTSLCQQGPVVLTFFRGDW